MACYKNDILSIIDKNVSLLKLEKELHGTKNSEIFTSIQCSKSWTGVCLNDYIQLHGQITGCDMKQSYITVLINELHLFTSNALHVCLDAQQMSLIELLVKNLDSYSTLVETSTAICANLSNFQHCIPVTVLQTFNNQKLLEFLSFLKWNIGRKQILKELVYALQVCSLSEVEEHQRLVSDLFWVLIKCGYSLESSSDKTLTKVCQYLVQYVFTHVLSQLNTPNTKNRNNLIRSVFHFIGCNKECSPKILSSCYLQLLASYSTKNASYKVSDAIMGQPNWLSYSMPANLHIAYQEILASCSFEEISSAIKKVLSREEINWNSTLTFVSSVLVRFKEAPLFFEEVITDELRSGLEENSQNKLVVGLLLARQCAAEGSQFFPSYSSWFQKYLNSGSHNLIASTRHFRFFMKFLTTLVPFEPFHLIKVHLLHPPHPPNPALRELTRTYKSIALTRIDDLKRCDDRSSVEREVATRESLVVCGNSLIVKKDSAPSLDRGCILLLLFSRKQRVEDVVESFGKTSKVPSNVVEMSIFRKSYYLNNFLPALLKARPLPDVADDRMKLISLLFKQGKIPKPMHAAYESRCADENARLVQEIIDLDDDFEEPARQLDRLRAAVADLLSVDHEPNERVLADYGVSLCRILHQLCLDPSASDIAESVIIEVDSGKNENEGYTQIVSTILNSFDFNRSISYDSLVYFFRTLAVFSCLREAICCRLWNEHKSQIKKEDGTFNTSDIMFMIGCCSNEDWFVKFSLSRIPFSDSSIKQKASLLEAVLMTSLHHVSVTCFVKETQFCANAVEQLKKLHNFSADSISGRSLKLVHDQLDFAKIRVDHFQREGTSCCFSSSKRRRLPNSNDQQTLLDSGFLKRLESSCAFLRSSLESTRLSSDDELIEFVRREIEINCENDFLSHQSRSQLYEHLLCRESIELGVIRKLIEFLVEDSKTFANKQLCDFILKNLASILQLAGCQYPGDWLLEHFREKVNAVISADSNDISRRVAHKRQVLHLARLLLRLPSAFLFFHLQATASLRWSQLSLNMEDICRSLKIFFDEFLRHFLFELEISDEICSHVFQGLIQIVSDDFSPLVEWLSFQVPLLFVFLLVRWEGSPNLRNLCKMRCSRLHDSVSLLRTTMHCDDIENVSLDRSSVMRLSPYPVCLTLLIINQNNSLRGISDVLLRLQPLFSHIVTSFLSCTIAYAAQRIETDETCEIERYIKMIDSLLLQAPANVVCPALFHPDSSLFCLFSDSVSTTYYSFALIRLLAGTPSSLNIIADNSFLPDFLACYTKCCDDIDFLEPEVQSLLLQSVTKASTTTLRVEAQRPEVLDQIKRIISAELQSRRI